MKRRVILLLSIFLLAGVVLFSLNLISAQETSFCCEKTTSGAWCQNAPQAECDSAFRSVPTSCEATSYCKVGTCVNVLEGTCLPNTAQVTCSQDGGVWYDSPREEVNQCQLGCCLIGDQAAFVTQTRCLKLSSDYGLQTNFRTDIQSETACIAAATPQAKGACVFEGDFGRDCRFITKSECQNLPGEFNQDFLCSSSELNAGCGPSRQTTCVEGKDEVYYLDTCGNLANVYDSSKVDDQDYWERIEAPDCRTATGIDAARCGDCDYFRGDTCAPERPGRSAEIGDNVCIDLGCEDQKFREKFSENPQHGETWCETETSNEATNSPGGRHFRKVCYNGDVTVEPCADYRQEICIQGTTGVEGNTFSSAVCRVNRWQDCIAQDNKKDCGNVDKRDCRWLLNVSILKDDNGLGLVVDENDKLVPREEEDETRRGASCVPRYSPGLDFWNSEGDAATICSVANTQCFVKFKKGIFAGEAGWEIDQINGIERNKYVDIACLEASGEIVDIEGDNLDGWAKEMNDMCISLGDCGFDVNYEGGSGFYDPVDLFTKIGELGDPAEEEEE